MYYEHLVLEETIAFLFNYGIHLVVSLHCLSGDGANPVLISNRLEKRAVIV